MAAAQSAATAAAVGAPVARRDRALRVKRKRKRKPLPREVARIVWIELRIS